MRLFFCCSVLALLLASLPVWANYTIITQNGQVMAAQQKYVIDQNGMVSFRLVSGPQISLSKETIDWHETARVNKEEVPPWATPKKRTPNRVDVGKSLDLNFDSVMDELTMLREQGLRWDTLGSVRVGGWIALGVLFVILYVLFSVVLHVSLNIAGEPNPFLRVFRWNAGLIFASILVQVVFNFLPVSFWYVMILALVSNYFVLCVLVIQIFEADIPSAMMGAFIYYAFSVFCLFGLWKATIILA